MTAENTNGFIEENLPILQDEGDTTTASTLAGEWGMNIERQTYLMEKAVKYGQRLLQARNTLIRMFTYAEDWSVFGEGEKAKACLSAAGALRIVDKANFPIQYRDVTSRKENILDKDGSVIGYRYVFEGYATLDSRTVHAIGQYSTRDAFLGKAGGEWRDPSEINESHIRTAAHTFFKGSAAKDLLGLKNIPLAEWERLTQTVGQDTTRATSVHHAQGTGGGITAGQRAMQDEILVLLQELAGMCLVISSQEVDGKIIKTIAEPSGAMVNYISTNNADPTDIYVKSSLKAMTTWVNKGGKAITGHTDIRKLSAKQAPYIKKEICQLMEKEGLMHG
jgi:hypothetical protein